MKDNKAKLPNLEDVTLDLRQELSRTPEPWEPLFTILWTASQLATGQALRVVAPFRPVLLIKVMEAQGFTHRATHNPAGDWDVVFEPAQALPGESMPASAKTKFTERSIKLNFRGLKKPPPIAKLIGALLHLPEKTDLILYTDEKPAKEALPENCSCAVRQSDLQPDGSFKTRIQLRE